MTKLEKIRVILDYAFEGTTVSAQNRAHTLAQFEAETDEEIERKYAAMLRRQNRA